MRAKEEIENRERKKEKIEEREIAIEDRESEG